MNFKELKNRGEKWLKDVKSLSQNRQALKYGLPAMVILLLINTVQIARFNSVIRPLTHYSEGLVDDLGSFRRDITAFGNDINEMRSYLLLPTKDYSFAQEETAELAEDQKKSSDTEQALYLYLGQFVSDRNTASKVGLTRALATNLPKNEALVNGLKELGLSAGKLVSTETAIAFKVGTPTINYFEVLGDLETGDLSLRSTLGTSLVLDGADETAIAQRIVTEVKTGKEMIDATLKTAASNKTLIDEALKNADLLKLLEQKKLSLPPEPQTEDGNVRYVLQDAEGEIRLTLIVGKEDGKVRLNEEILAPEADVTGRLIAAVSQLDGTTATEKRVRQTRTELEAILQEEAFKELLASSGLAVTLEPREDYNKLLYDVLNAEGKVQFSFVIELSSGLVKVLKDDRETDILSAIGENVKKKP